MSYNKLNNAERARLESIELTTKYGETSYKDAPRPESSLDHNMKTTDSKKVARLRVGAGFSLPVEPRRPAAFTPIKTLVFVFDFILASMPIMFIALALVGARMNGKPISPYGSRLDNTLLLSPTIFPFIFAALMGRFFRHLGVYLAERGTTLGRLEQIFGCQSVFLAIERQFCLRPLSVVGILSIVVWLLSPLGGQSALRLLDQHEINANFTSTLRYMDPQTSEKTFLQGGGVYAEGRPTATSIFLAALLSGGTYQASPVDFWGNFKLPLYRQMVNTTSDGWRTMTEDTLYASMIGIPIINYNTSDQRIFNIKARQFDVVCSDNKLLDRDATNFGNLTATWKLQSLTPGPMCNSTNADNCAPFCRDYPCPFVSKSLANQTEPEFQFSVANCSLSYDYYELNVFCGDYCRVQKMRKIDPFQDGFTPSDDTGIRTLNLDGLLRYLPTLDDAAGTSILNRGPTTMEKWMYNSNNYMGLDYGEVPLWKLSPETFSERLTVLLNTFWQSTYATTALGGVSANNLTSAGVLQGSRDINTVNFNSTAVNIVSNLGPHYRTNWKWFIALMVSSLVLLIAGYVGLALKYLALAPDIIGYASSLTLLNPYITVPTGGTTLHGLQRSARLHDLPVRLGDVCAEEEFGSIALGQADIGRVGKLKRDRYYI